MQEEIIEDSGIVKKVEGNSVIVEIERGGGCNSCKTQGFCLSCFIRSIILVVLKPCS